ncbi:oxidoreductase [Epithele typhae]|uniref:oxidoreductase n=1 Tax=Epithele typhae TaxID=378194 RepID=UPI002008517C|nr:oxidoreductase [Epithele typhae]KAH9933618.1 oxidoreductase [Epithele typhae]
MGLSIPSIAVLASVLGIFTLSIIAYEVWSLLVNKWDPRGKHCFVTGGSSGAGFALAQLLVRKGAHVSIVARNQANLDDALAKLEKERQSPDQVLKAYSFAVNSEAGSAAALEAACEPFKGRAPDAVFTCAGASRPGFFVELNEESLRQGLELTYYAQAFTALAATKAMVRTGVKGKIVFVSSVLGYFSMVGYAAYASGKFALRGLAETLHSEFKLYGIDVHIAFPGTIYSRGYEEENQVKPAITLKLEETDSGDTPEAVATGILSGVQTGRFHITPTFLGNVFRSSTAGASERNSYVVDPLFGLIGYIGLPIWRLGVDSTVKGHREEHKSYLHERGLIPSERVPSPVDVKRRSA